MIAVTHQHRPHARLLVHQHGEFARDGEHDVFFMCTRGAARTDILAAMTGIDGDDQFATALEIARGAAERELVLVEETGG